MGKMTYIVNFFFLDKQGAHEEIRYPPKATKKSLRKIKQNLHKKSSNKHIGRRRKKMPTKLPQNPHRKPSAKRSTYLSLLIFKSFRNLLLLLIIEVPFLASSHYGVLLGKKATTTSLPIRLTNYIPIESRR